MWQYAHNIRILAINFAGYKPRTGKSCLLKCLARLKILLNSFFSMLSDVQNSFYVTFSCSKDFCLHTVKILVLPG